MKVISMKVINCITALFLLTVGTACSDRDLVNSKPGVSLPPVTDLALEKTDANHVELSWQIPSALSEEIVQPVSVFIEAKEILGPTRAVSVFSIMLPDAPTTFTYELPDASKRYHITVKLYGKTESKDPNYSTEAYSEGMTVNYEPGS